MEQDSPKENAQFAEIILKPHSPSKTGTIESKELSLSYGSYILRIIRSTEIIVDSDIKHIGIDVRAFKKVKVSGMLICTLRGENWKQGVTSNRPCASFMKKCGIYCYIVI